jgi:hypothetical protein
LAVLYGKGEFVQSSHSENIPRDGTQESVAGYISSYLRKHGNVWQGRVYIFGGGLIS